MKNMKIAKEEMDFLREIINIGTGNAAGALEQLLGARINVEIPVVKIINHAELSSVINSPDKPVLGVKMGIVGNVTGNLFFIVPHEHKAGLMTLAERARPAFGKAKMERDGSVIEEIGNIMSGVYLTAIHDFTGLNIYHTVPCMSTDMLLSLIDESIADKMRAASDYILIENSFRVDGKPILKAQVFFIMILSIDSIRSFLDSMQTARKKMHDEQKGEKRSLVQKV